MKKEYAFEEAEELFRKQWQWAAQTGEWKGNWPGLKKNPAENDCYCCEIVRSYCNECPITWGNNYAECEESFMEKCQLELAPCECPYGSLFAKYIRCFEFECINYPNHFIPKVRLKAKAKSLAAKIAKLPWERR
jgi:DNA polymerase III delta prime subunit